MLNLRDIFYPAKQAPLRVEEDYDYLLTFLPDGWEEKARELGGS